MLKILRLAAPVALGALPVLALAQGIGGGDLESAFEEILDLINNIIIPLIVGIAGLYFMWGIIKYITAGDSEESRTAARNMMIWGIIALFVMISVWGLVNILVETFGGRSFVETEVPLPNIPEDN